MTAYQLNFDLQTHDGCLVEYPVEARRGSLQANKQSLLLGLTGRVRADTVAQLVVQAA